ncbi:hypothetical protein CERSUDRAFT_146870 [Gelatoporia subvermispora B]|uniref:Asparagine synthetase domain-containing protein n=1 Tax=Ceriporiopsis subvermispora (strain B) TaxID=914234 RepID=M2RTA8_CERS8|nr:hypothetical protein CERSUDRAFT_146870 [Gelatoporia subvermispora B]
MREGRAHMTFFASELRLRGDSPIVQPHRDVHGNILCWNGEIFEGIDISPDANDGALLFSRLCAADTIEDVRDLLGSIEGPYALVYYHARLHKIVFARDPLGRRSLLINRPTPEYPYLVLASVSVGAHPAYAPEELSTDHIYALDLGRLVTDLTDFTSSFETCLQTMPRRGDSTSSPYAELRKVNRFIPEDPPQLQDLNSIPSHLSSAVDDLLDHLDRSVMLRVRNIPRVGTHEGQARVAVLFSGGIDSTMLAFLAHRHVDPSEPIDLLNVAFENPRKISVQIEGNIGALKKREKKLKMKERLDYSTVNVEYDVPDRLTGAQEVEELRRLCPGRKWNFVEVNVPYEESQAARPLVEALMFPGRTVMDLSLAVALYFAARGVGQIRSHPGAVPEPYTSPARVLLNGLGSDELLGGYGRHRTAFKHAGWQAIVDELQLELDRIPTRNLGRDDRVISSHGKETRHPFLSLSVVDYLAQLPVHVKLDPRLEAGLGEKMLLRLAARKVGLLEASLRKKKAMQFGSHSARMIPGADYKKGDVLLNS